MRREQCCFGLAGAGRGCECDTHADADAFRRIQAAVGGWYRLTVRVTFSLRDCAKLSLVHSSEKHIMAVANNAQGLRKKATTKLKMSRQK